MPRKRSSDDTRTPSGPFIVMNPRNIPLGRHIILWHVCEDDITEGHDQCFEDRWYEGDEFIPPEGFGLKRFLDGGFLEAVK